MSRYNFITSKADDINALIELSKTFDDAIHQAEFIADWTQTGKLKGVQLDDELNILIALVANNKTQLSIFIDKLLEQEQALEAFR